MDTILLKLVKFCLVGFSGTILDFSLTGLLKEKLQFNKYVANSCGFVTAASSNFFLNRIWTFGSYNERIHQEYLSFFLISLIGLGLNNLMLWVFHNKLTLNFYLSKFCAILIVTAWNFVMNYLFTF